MLTIIRYTDGMFTFRPLATARSTWLSLACAAAICWLAVQLMPGGEAPTQATGASKTAAAANETEALVPTYHAEDLEAVEASLETIQG